MGEPESIIKSTRQGGRARWEWAALKVRDLSSRRPPPQSGIRGVSPCCFHHAAGSLEIDQSLNPLVMGRKGAQREVSFLQPSVLLDVPPHRWTTRGLKSKSPLSRKSLATASPPATSRKPRCVSMCVRGSWWKYVYTTGMGDCCEPG